MSVKFVKQGKSKNLPPPKKPRKKRKHKRPDWGAIATDYFRKNLETDRKEMYTLAELAKSWGLSVGTVRNKSYQLKWQETLAQMRDEKSKRVLDKITDLEAEEEAVVRIRQARVARMMVVKAANEIKRRDMRKMSDKDVLMMLRHGMEEERKALGFGQTFRFQLPDESDDDYESVMENQRKHQEALENAASLSDFLEHLTSEQRGIKDIDGEATVIDDQPE